MQILRFPRNLQKPLGKRGFLACAATCQNQNTPCPRKIPLQNPYQTNTFREAATPIEINNRKILWLAGNSRKPLGKQCFPAPARKKTWTGSAVGTPETLENH